MFKKIVSIALVTVCCLQTVPAQTQPKTTMPALPSQKTDDDATDKRFWPLVAGSGILFITGVVLFAMADDYEDRAASGLYTDEEEDDYIRKAALYWPLAVTTIGTSTGLGLWALKLRFEPQTGLVHAPARPAVGLSYSFRF